eukprot:2212666-Lingulodinium_polyedra.AAC.2
MAAGDECAGDGLVRRPSSPRLQPVSRLSKALVPGLLLARAGLKERDVEARQPICGSPREQAKAAVVGHPHQREGEVEDAQPEPVQRGEGASSRFRCIARQ